MQLALSVTRRTPLEPFKRTSYQPGFCGSKHQRAARLHTQNYCRDARRIVRLVYQALPRLMERIYHTQLSFAIRTDLY